jgi:ABC-type glutathione transport system ATPase component
MLAELQLSSLRVRVGDTPLVHDVSLSLSSGRVVGLVGPSGSGKTLTARALLGLVTLRPGVCGGDYEVRCGSDRWRPFERPSDWQALRGDVLGYLPQAPRHALDPFQRVGALVKSAARRGPNAGSPPRDWLLRAGFEAAQLDAVLERYPHELSGGMAQRVALAQALARGSRLLVADEPTTGLDAPVQLALLEQLRALASEGVGVLLVSHDLRWLAAVADEVVLLEGGRSVERLAAHALARGEAISAVGRRLHQAAERLRSPGFPS